MDGGLRWWLLGLAADLLGVAAGIMAIRSSLLPRLAGWVLMVSFALHPLLWLTFDGIAGCVGSLLLAAAGITFVVAALRLKIGAKP